MRTSSLFGKEGGNRSDTLLLWEKKKKTSGVFDSLGDVKPLVEGVSGAVYRRFKTQEAAKSFVEAYRLATEAVESNGPSEPTFYYAVAKGRGADGVIYESWAEASAQVIGTKGAVHQKFRHYADAEAFIRLYQEGNEYGEDYPPLAKSYTMREMEEINQS